MVISLCQHLTVLPVPQEMFEHSAYQPRVQTASPGAWQMLMHEKPCVIPIFKCKGTFSDSVTHSMGGSTGSGIRRKSQVAICFLKNTGMDPPSRGNWTHWVLLLLEGGSYCLL